MTCGRVVPVHCVLLLWTDILVDEHSGCLKHCCNSIIPWDVFGLMALFW